MMKSMNLQTRREFLKSVRTQYQESNWLAKGKILDGFIAASGYNRKYAIKLLNATGDIIKSSNKRCSRVKYDEQVRQAIIALWYAANQICSKRFVPFIPNLVETMERNGHLHLSTEVREKVLDISRSTVDRILKVEKKKTGSSISTTKTGNLFKHQIRVRTFADWDDVTPGFLEADLVAHCGGDVNGSFLNTLTLTDISTGWTECLPLLRKTSGDVIIGLKLAQDLLPFPLLGVDTDNGSEFINHEILKFCEDNQITFTRSRAYRKNDQAHVEQKNGSVVRRIVGYDRFEGRAAWEALGEMYRILRVYINFFQPSLKLISKERNGAKVKKKYDTAKTPHQRVVANEAIDQKIKDLMNEQYKKLDPVELLRRLESLQSTLFNYAWSSDIAQNVLESENTPRNVLVLPKQCDDPDNVENGSNSINTTTAKLYHYRSTRKIDKRKEPRDWKTRKDPFERVWNELRLKLELNPETTAKSLLDGLIVKYPNEYTLKHLRTLQRRVALWRREQYDQEERLRAIIIPEAANYCR